MTSNDHQLFVIRIPSAVDKKSLNGCAIDVSGGRALIEDVSYGYECQPKPLGVHLVHLVTPATTLHNDTHHHLKANTDSQVTGYIGFRVDHSLLSHDGRPLDKRHVMQPMDQLITQNTNDSRNANLFSKKHKRKRKK